MMFVGPSGVGKTETARALAEDLFGGVERMIRFDMSEFSEPTAATRLIGTRERPDGELTGRVRLQPFCVLLFDEIEKAHQSVLDLLLQILGDGRLTDAAGRTVDFTNAIIVMTSNLGADIEGRAVGFSEQNRSDRAQHYRRAAESFFRPELFNRIDTIVPYRPLGSDALRRIARRTLDDLLERRGLKRARILVDVDDELVDRMVRDAVDPRYGARTLARHIERRLVTPLARGLTTHDTSGALTRVSIAPDGERAPVSVDFVDVERAPPRPAPPGRRLARLEAHELVGRFERIRDELARLESGASARKIEGEYDEILARFGDDREAGEDASWSVADADRLRRREAFLSQRDALRSALDDFLVPDESGDLELPALDERDRAARRHWTERLVDFEGRLCWMQLQLEDLRRGDRDASRGAVLVSTAIADPQCILLEAWRGRLRALDELLDLDAVASVRRRERWEPFDLTHDLPGDARGVAIATTVPGAPRVFEMIRGYVWRPGPPPRRRHALLLHEVLEAAAHDEEDLLEMLEERGPGGRHDSGDGAAPCIEYEVVDSSLRDLREGTKVAVGGSPALITETTWELLYPRLARAAELPPVSGAGADEGRVPDAYDSA
jgi:ATP-dependent Clp protease ATP-binding subunit ClpC